MGCKVKSLYGVHALSIPWRHMAVAVALLPGSLAQAQSQPATVSDRGDVINWYYAATFGTGIYSAGDRSVSVLQVPFSHSCRQRAKYMDHQIIFVPVNRRILAACAFP